MKKNLFRETFCSVFLSWDLLTYMPFVKAFSMSKKLMQRRMHFFFLERKNDNTPKGYKRFCRGLKSLVHVKAVTSAIWILVLLYEGDNLDFSYIIFSFNKHSSCLKISIGIVLGLDNDYSKGIYFELLPFQLFPFCSFSHCSNGGGSLNSSEF